MSIVEFFDPSNRGHIEAYAYLNKTGKWPDDFLPADIDKYHMRVLGVAVKIAEYHVKTTLGDSV